ncbi:Structural maintenance of chromosomes protein 6 [Binucleata daphniae]
MTLIFDSLELVNFMCHSHLKINFEKKVTFIAGLNGSGKSAIMIAIGLILGERVKSLERGNSAKDLIKTNKSFALIKLVLHNTAQFYADFFEDKIYIEKKITLKGTVTSIYNKHNKMWKRKKEDLEQLLEHFSISFNNPINFLTQEHAKKFLNVTKPDILYEFFMKGTELEENKFLHKEAVQEAEEMNKKIEEVQKRTDLIDNELKKGKKQIEAIENIKIWEYKILRNELEIKWSRLNLQKIQVLNDEIYDLECTLADEEKIYSKDLNKSREMNVKHTQKMKERRKKADEKQEEKERIEAKITEYQLNVREMENDLREIEESINKQEKEIKEQHKGYDEESLEKIINKTKEQKIKLEKLNEEREDTEKQKNELVVVSEKEAERIQNIKTQTNRLKTMIEESRRIKNNRLTYFGSKIPEFVNEVQNTRFVGKVIGPLSNVIHLKESKWYKPVSNILNNFLNAYIVYEREDKERMYAIMKKYGINNVSLFVPSKNSDKIIQYRKNSRYKTVLDVISCDDVAVINQLIILAQIESIILIEHRSEAHSVIKSRPNDVDCAFTLNGDQIKMYGNNLTDFAVNVTDRYFFQNSTDKINDLELQLNELRNKSLQNKYTNELYITKRKLEDTETLIERLKNEIRSNEIEIKSITAVKSKVFEKDIENVQEELNINYKQRDELKCAMEATSKEIYNCRQNIDRLEIQEKYDESIHKNEQEALKERMEESCIKLNKISKEIEKRENEIEQIKQAAEKQRTALLDLGPPFCNPRSEREIMEETYELNAKIKIHTEAKDEENIKITMKEYENEKSQNIKLIEETHEKLNIMKKFIEKRIQKREEIKNKESLRATDDFKTHMMKREYEGKLIFDHENEHLQIKVKLKNSKKEGDKNTLSGGEKSYAGICLLLSLWPSVTCPIKILDEFDVFMDNLNRNAAIESIVKYSENEKSQLILITPLDTYNLKNNYCDVVVLEPPRKTDTTAK